MNERVGERSTSAAFGEERRNLEKQAQHLRLEWREEDSSRLLSGKSYQFFNKKWEA